METKNAPFSTLAPSESSLQALIDQLAETHHLKKEEYALLLQYRSPSLQAYTAKRAETIRIAIYGRTVYLRGLIEVTNICQQNCYYCGLRKGNVSCQRYRLTEAEILSCCAKGDAVHFRTFVLQGGEDPYWNDERLVALLQKIKHQYPDTAVTLSLGERSAESYRRLKEAGADRYLLRHETANPIHFARLHPPTQTLKTRMQALHDLREAGFYVGCGFMVGSPGQTYETLAEDLAFVETFHPEMCGIGPFIPHHATPFAQEPAGSVEDTLFCLSLVRLMHPTVLLPSTTALGTLHPTGRELGIQAGANVIMPNLSPMEDRSKYELYNNKLSSGAEAAENIAELARRLGRIGYEVSMSRGDPAQKPFSEEENHSTKTVPSSDSHASCRMGSDDSQ